MPVASPCRRWHRYAVAAVLALVATLGSACSSAAAGADATAQEFLRALGEKDTARACELTAYDGNPLAGDDLALCRTGYDTLVNELFSTQQLSELRAATVTGVALDGDTATIPDSELTGGLEAYLGDIGLVRVRGRWYVNTSP